MPTPAHDLDVLRTTRRLAASALAAAFSAPAPTEASLAAAWTSHMRRAGISWFWYAPPPEGTNVLSGHPDQTRLALESFRPEPAWPGPHQVVSRAPVTVYTSPVADTGLIGDFGLTLYTGPDRAIRDHLSRVADLVAGLTHHVRPGLRYCDLYAHARRSWEAADLTNDIASTTDPAGTNIGHSIPFFASPRPEITPGPGGSLILSQNREFNSATNNAEITDTCAFTIEPRLGAPGLPVVWFHVVVVFIEGVKHVITEFDPVLAALGCSWFANPWT